MVKEGLVLVAVVDDDPGVVSQKRCQGGKCILAKACKHAGYYGVSHVAATKGTCPLVKGDEEAGDKGCLAEAAREEEVLRCERVM